MRVLLNHTAAGWEALPFIAAAGLAYGWIVSRLLSRKPEPKVARVERKAA